MTDTVAPQLILCAGTLGAASFADRVEAAAESGYASIGLRIDEYNRLRARGWSDDDLQAVLVDFGVEWTEVEMIAGFAAPSGPANIPARPGLMYAMAEDEHTAFHIADVFGARHLQVTGAFGDVPLEPHVVDAFGALCDRALEHALKIALEFVPYTNIGDLKGAAGIVAAAGRANGGLCVDSWHYFQGNAGDLRSVPADHVVMIQLNDGVPLDHDDDRMYQAVHARRCPGDGTFDLVTFLRDLAPALPATPISVEVFSDELSRLPSGAAAQRAADATRAVLQRV